MVNCILIFFSLWLTCSCIVCCGKSAMIFRCITNIANKNEFPIGNSAAMSYTRCWQIVLYFQITLIPINKVATIMIKSPNENNLSDSFTCGFFAPKPSFISFEYLIKSMKSLLWIFSLIRLKIRSKIQ